MPKQLTLHEAAVALGMKDREIVDLVPVAGGTVAVDHCGVPSLIDDDGRYVGPHPLPTLEDQRVTAVRADDTADDAGVTSDPVYPPAGGLPAPGSDAELDELRKQAEILGVTVDRRWKADRLRKEIDAAGTP